MSTILIKGNAILLQTGSECWVTVNRGAHEFVQSFLAVCLLPVEYFDVICFAFVGALVHGVLFYLFVSLSMYSMYDFFLAV